MNDNLILIDSWSDIGIDQRPGVTQTKYKCPACAGTRSNKGDKSLSVNFQMGVANCHSQKCQVVYKIKSQDLKPFPQMKVPYKRPAFNKLPVSNHTIDFFKGRGISASTLAHYRVTDAIEWMPGKDGEHEGKQFSIKAGSCYAIAFNYYLRGEHVNTKFRASQKRFKMVSGAELAFYGIDFLEGVSECAIQEGEIDTLSAYECGITNSVSVPNGASIGSNLKLEYLDNCIGMFDGIQRIVIAADGDAAGRALSAELIRRLGPERCFVVEYPEGCKDTNEVLLKYGKEVVKAMYENAKPVPIIGIATAEQVTTETLDLYDNGFPPTFKVGYPNFDKLLSFRGGELTMVTGIPGHGKTTFLDQLLVRLSARYGWRTMIFSPENHINLQTQKLSQKLIGKSTFGRERMSREEMIFGIGFVNEHFSFVKYDEVETDIEGILAKARELVVRKGINAVVIDPYNCIEHKIPRGYSETQYISELLTKITSFAKINNVHVFLVAHPTKIDKDKATQKYEVPTLYKISGSANFYNKTDNGFTVYLNGDTVEVHVQKVKFDFVGEKGKAEFYYDRPTGRYREYEAKQDSELDYYVKRKNEAARKVREGYQAVMEFPTPSEPAAAEEAPQVREPGVLTNINDLVGKDYEPPF